MDNQTTDDKPKKLDEHQQKLLALPSFVLDWMYSQEAGENNAEIVKKFNLGSDKNPIIAKLTAQVILKEITLDALPLLLQEKLKVDGEVARRIALGIALKQLLVIRDHLRGVENFILKLGGTIPSTLPKMNLVSPAGAPIPIQPISTALMKKPFRQAVQENKEILNQLLTANPIKIAEFEQPVRPTIKNWLSDYIKLKGTGYHDELERSDYLYKSSNATNLAGEERARLAKILKAYDEDSEVPVSSDTKLISVEELSKKETPPSLKAATPPPAQAPLSPQPAPMPPPPAKPVAPLPPTPAPAIPTPSPPPAPTIPPSPAPKPMPRTGPDTYREPVSEEDLEGPLKPPTRPAPRIEGNVVDLKNINE